MLCSALAGVQTKAAFELSIATVATIAHLAHRHEANKRALCDASAAAADSPLFRTLVRMLESASTCSLSALHASGTDRVGKPRRCFAALCGGAAIGLNHGLSGAAKQSAEERRAAGLWPFGVGRRRLVALLQHVVYCVAAGCAVLQHRTNAARK